MAGLAKPAKGTAKAERASRRRDVENSERKNKALVRKRDKTCRWPGCECKGRTLGLEVAHLKAKGMGGDHGKRSTPDQMILLCRERHQGPWSLHSGHCRIYLTGPYGAPEFFQRSTVPGKDWERVR